MSKRYRDSGPVPNRWMNCPRKSAEVIIGKFIAFKTPLSSAFDDKVPPECRFPPSMLFELCKAKKIKIGLWIDLTNTNRFYNKDEVERTGCKYLKLQCRGHGETPSIEQTNTFISLVHNFIIKNPLDCIAVHCTHGFNRTGFLIVSYIIERMDCSLDIAKEIFAKARPPGIYKEDYINELYRRYDDANEAPPPPNMPDWCFEDNASPNEGDSGYSEPHESVAGSSQNDEYQPSKKHFKRNPLKKVPVFMEGIPGVSHFDEQPKSFYLQQKVHKYCEWKGKGFPGAQPVSMDRNNIKFLSTKPYRVSWKADGTRYMMLIDEENEIYFFDRDHNVFRVDGLSFPHRKEHRHLRNTLIDGEMVIDKVNGENIPRYLAYDIIKFEGQDVGKMPFYPVRLHCIENEIIKPRHMAMESGDINKTLEPFSVRKKDFWHVTQATGLLGEKFARTLSHEPDGLIFQPSKEPYKGGQCEDVLKWKPLDMNSVDFRMKIVREGGEGLISQKVCHLFVGKRDLPFGKMKYTKELKDLDSKIVECMFDYEKNQWKFMRERTDKSFPNSVDTAMAVCESIKHPVTKEYLLEFIAEHRFDDDHEVMPPPPPSRRPRR